MLQTRYPHVTLIARQANRLVIGRMLDDGEVDVGIVASPVLGTQHRQEPLFESGYRCIFDGPRLGLTGPLTLDAFLRYRHVLVSFDGRRGIVDDLLDAEGLSRTVLSATTHFAGVIVMLKAVDAIATIPEHSALAYAKAANLTTSPPPIRMPTFVVSLVWHASRAADPRNTWLRRQIMEFQL
jgi:LysR family transcriptional activator of mexEF-oprN operon